MNFYIIDELRRRQHLFGRRLSCRYFKIDKALKAFLQY